MRKYVGRCYWGLLFAAIMICGCAGNQASRIGERRVVETSGGKPSWCKGEKDSWTDDGQMKFRGVVTDQYALDAGLRNAKAACVKSVAEQVKIRVRTDYYNSLKGSNASELDLGRDAADLIQWTTDNLEITGVAATKSYWERLEVTTDTGVQYTHDTWALIEVPETDYRRAVRKASDSLEARAKEENNQAAEDRAKEFKKYLYGE